MRTDPRAACANTDERLLWALVHDAIAHPLMALTLYSRWFMKFHDFTSHRAWPRAAVKPAIPVPMPSRHGEVLVTRMLTDRTYGVRCPFLKAHTLVVQADDVMEAVEKAEAWFDELVCGGAE